MSDKDGLNYEYIVGENGDTKVVFYDEEGNQKGPKKKKPNNNFKKIAVVTFSALLIFGVGYKFGETKDNNISEYNQDMATENQKVEPEIATTNNVVENEVSEKEQYVALASDNKKGELVDIIGEASNSVVSISVEQVENSIYGFRAGSPILVEGAGSGIIVYEDENNIYIVTNNHVVKDAQKISISLDDSQRVEASVVGLEPSADLAVISVSKEKLKELGIEDYSIAKFADSDKIKIGEDVIAIGNAAGEGKSATKGIVSAVNKSVSFDDGLELGFIQTDAAINPGNSGGALINNNGDVIGVNTAKYADFNIEGMGYSIPSNTVKAVVEDIIKNGGSNNAIKPISNDSKVYLGVGGRLTNGYDLPIGFYIVNIQKDGNAEGAGLLEGDILAYFNGVRIEHDAALVEALSTVSVGQEVEIVYFRDEKLHTVNIILE